MSINNLGFGDEWVDTEHGENSHESNLGINLTVSGPRRVDGKLDKQD